MKMLVFSDSHKSSYNMQKVIDMHINTTDYIFHLGDGTEEFGYISNQYPEKTFLSVAGNYECGMRSYGKSELLCDVVLNIDGYKFWLTHGHNYNVKSGYDLIETLAYNKGVNVVLFGHTHTAYKEYISDKKIWLFCPGSISRPIDLRPNYGIIEIRKGNIILTNAIF